MNPYEKQYSQSLALSGKQNYTIPRITPPKSAQDAAYKKAVNNNVCYPYNMGRCPNQADQSCKQINSKDGSLSKILKHICNICGRRHPGRDHPKMKNQSIMSFLNDLFVHIYCRKTLCNSNKSFFFTFQCIIQYFTPVFSYNRPYRELNAYVLQ